MKKLTPHEMCFGLNEELDRKSFNLFLNLIGQEQFAKQFSQRISVEDIDKFTHDFTVLLKKYLSESDYHSLFLKSPHE